MQDPDVVELLNKLAPIASPNLDDLTELGTACDNKNSLQTPHLKYA